MSNSKLPTTTQKPTEEPVTNEPVTDEPDILPPIGKSFVFGAVEYAKEGQAIDAAKIESVVR